MTRCDITRPASRTALKSSFSLSLKPAMTSAARWLGGNAAAGKASRPVAAIFARLSRRTSSCSERAGVVRGGGGLLGHDAFGG